ncbi:MAG: PEP-CTERM sorting domain-containing protein [Planctomycetota bacterium]
MNRTVFAVSLVATLCVVSPASAQFAVPDTDIEAFLGLPAGSLDVLSATTPAGGTATSGSALKTSFDVFAGDTLDVDVNFLTDESTPELEFNDFAFLSILVDGVLDVLADTNSSFVVSPSLFDQETGFFSYSHTFLTDGTVELGLGVLDESDQVVDSGLLVDNIALNGTLISNGGFESGDFTDFDTIGSAAIVDTGFGTGPATGAFNALLSTEGVPEPSAILSLGVVLCSCVACRNRYEAV